jgi:hypothetical protein
MSLEREPSPMELFVEMHVRSQPAKRGPNSSLTTVLNTLWYVCSTILFRKLLFLLN